MSPDPLAQAEDIRNGVERTTDMLVAAFAIFLYDWVITISDEVRDQWPSPFSMVKVLYFFNRFATLMTLIVLVIVNIGDFTEHIAQACRSISIIVGIVISTIFLSWNWIMAIQVHAIYGLQPWVKYFLATTLAVANITAVIFTVHEGRIFSDSFVTAIGDVGSCLGTSFPKYYYVVWIPGACFELVMFIMLIWKLVPALKKTKNSVLIQLLLRDRTLYYLVITCLRLVNLILFIHGDLHIVYMGLYPTLGLGSTLISRVVLNLRHNTQGRGREVDLHILSHQHNIPLEVNGRNDDFEMLPTNSNLWGVPSIN